MGGIARRECGLFEMLCVFVFLDNWFFNRLCQSSIILKSTDK